MGKCSKENQDAFAKLATNGPRRSHFVQRFDFVNGSSSPFGVNVNADSVMPSDPPTKKRRITDKSLVPEQDFIVRRRVAAIPLDEVPTTANAPSLVIVGAVSGTMFCAGYALKRRCQSKRAAPRSPSLDMITVIDPRSTN